MADTRLEVLEREARFAWMRKLSNDIRRAYLAMVINGYKGRELLDAVDSYAESLGTRSLNDDRGSGVDFLYSGEIVVPDGGSIRLLVSFPADQFGRIAPGPDGIERAKEWCDTYGQTVLD